MRKKTLIRKPFYFMRHGQTDWNVARRWQGQTDIPLNDYGREQARQAQQLLQKHAPDIEAIFYSPLMRAQETMLLATEHLSHCPRTAFDELKEWHFGELEGKTPDPSWPKSWYDAPPRGETRHEFYTRIRQVLHTILAHDKHPAIIIGHHATFDAICHHVQINKMSLANAQLVYVYPTGELGWEIELFHPQEDR